MNDEAPKASATAYHETIGELRGEIMDEYRFACQIADKHRPQRNDAYIAGRTAATYGYTLAAVLGVAEREFGPQIANRLAAVADEIMTNGDGADLNNDIAYQMANGDAE